MTILLQAPSDWQLPVVPSRFMPSGSAYVIDANGQVSANGNDVPALIGFGFFVTGSKASSLEALSDTLIASAANNDVLTWNSSAKKWENKPAGGGAAIQPETGNSGIKISAFPNAAAPMGAGDVVTGLQGGANANFSQLQLLSAPDAAALSGASGGSVIGRAGAGDGAGYGGNMYLYGGNAGATGSGGVGAIYGGSGGATSGNGGSATAKGGNATAGNGGSAVLFGGSAVGAGHVSGHVVLTVGAISGGATHGFVYIANLPTSNPGGTNRVWRNGGVLSIT